MSLLVSSTVKDPDKVKTRRAQIVSAAVQLFSEKGFHKTTTREIAKHSGLSNGALYEYVKSKEDVLFLVCQHIHHEMEEQLRLSLLEEAIAAVRLRHAIHSFFRVIDAMKDDVLLIYQETKSLSKDFLHEVLHAEQSITKVFEQLLFEGIADKSLELEAAKVPLFAHNIVVCGQMWAFRRWALSDTTFEQFSTLQVRMLMQACGEPIAVQD